MGSAGADLKLGEQAALASVNLDSEGTGLY